MATITRIDRQQTDSLAMVVAANVRAEVARRGLDQIDVAQALGVSRTWINARWRAHRPFSLADLELVARFLGMDPADLLAAPGRAWAPWDSNPQPTDYGRARGWELAA